MASGGAANHGESLDDDYTLTTGQALLDEVKERLQASATAEADYRVDALDDLNFCCAGKQWPEDMGRARREACAWVETISRAEAPQ